MADAYRFSDFKLLPRERLLLRHGAPLAIPARAFDVLVFLVAQQGRLVTKDELLTHVWAGVIVEENNIAVQIMVLRRQLGADAITTIAGVGYRFALEVRASEDDEAPPGKAGLPLSDKLPRPMTELIGRDNEMRELETLLGDQRLITICGSAGVGKTLLAQTLGWKAAPIFDHDAAWVELAPLSDGDLVASAIGAALGLASPERVAPLKALIAPIRTRRLLLVLDNAEHVSSSVASVCHAILSGTQSVAIVCTSQVPLHVTGELVYRLGALAVPSVPMRTSDAAAFGAVRLFAERARRNDRFFEVDDSVIGQIVEICRRLDGNALAIELAAARVEALGLHGLLVRLDQRLQLLAPGNHDSPSRSNALAAALDWSFSLLNPREQKVFLLLGAFSGGFTLDTAAMLVFDETPLDVTRTMAELVERSLVTATRGSSKRYHLLESGRLYALSGLERAGQMTAARTQHLRAMQQMMDEAFTEYWVTSDDRWVERYAVELDNLRSAMQWALQHDPRASPALFGAAYFVWDCAGQRDEARLLAARIAATLDDRVDPVLAARFWLAFTLALSREFPERARAAAITASELCAAVHDRRGQYVALTQYVFNWRVDHPDARRALAALRAIEDVSWPARIIERARTAEAVLELGVDHFDRARELYQEAMQISENQGYLLGAHQGRCNLADLELAAGNTLQAIAMGEALKRDCADQSMARKHLILLNLTSALIRDGQLQRAWECLVELRELVRREDPGSLWWALDALALLHALDDECESAARIVGAADANYALHGQHQRQANEAHDRERIGTLLDASLLAGRLVELMEEGARMSFDVIIDMAYAKARGSKQPPIPDSMRELAIRE